MPAPDFKLLETPPRKTPASPCVVITLDEMNALYPVLAVGSVAMEAVSPRETRVITDCAIAWQRLCNDMNHVIQGEKDARIK